MIDFITDMQSLEIRDETYDRFLAFKVKYNPNLSDEDFIQFLMTQFENCCSKLVCNGYTNGVTEQYKMDWEFAPKKEELDINCNNHLPTKEEDNVSVRDSQLFICPECKYTSVNQTEMEQHFNDCHDMDGLFPCTCGHCCNNMSHFLAHYIICPIAATDLQNTGLLDSSLDDKTSLIDEEKDITDASSPVQSREPSPQYTNDSNDKPIDFHLDSTTYSNPLNLVKNENPSFNKDSPVTDHSINAINLENNYSSSNDRVRLPRTNASSIAASSPSNPDQLKKPSKVYECEHCEKSFKSKGLLDQHKHLHFPPRHECEFCGRRFRWPPQFYTHKQQCSKRKQTAADSAIGATHEKTKSVKKHSYSFVPTTVAYTNQVGERVSQSENLFCDNKATDQCLCGYQSNNLNDIYEHKHSCLTSARAMIMQKLIDYKSIQTASLLPNMLTLHGNTLSTQSIHSTMQSFLSPISAADNNNGGLSVSTIATTKVPTLRELKPFECDFCESRFMTKISLKQHLDGKHSDRAKYCCEKCGKGYFWNASYNYHKKKCMIPPTTDRK